jgi:demethylmenaquinone methyltransferase/2-methoxy-6-polyprenyl-1,4-benzoquinol methylase
LYRAYTKYILPIVGKLISKDKSSYKYLSETANNFPFGEEFSNIMKDSADFSKVSYKKLFFGASYIYIGVK